MNSLYTMLEMTFPQLVLFGYYMSIMELPLSFLLRPP